RGARLCSRPVADDSRDSQTPVSLRSVSTPNSEIAWKWYPTGMMMIQRTTHRASGRFAAVISWLLLLTTSSIAHADADLKYSVSWIGNTFSGKHGWVLQDVAGIFVD